MVNNNFHNLNIYFIWSPPIYCSKCKMDVNPSYGKCPICNSELDFS